MDAGMSDALHSPAADRNKEPILEVLRRVLPRSGFVLEIAAGTGQHAVHFARALPMLTWQPGELDLGCRASIAAHVEAEALPNLLPPIEVDVRSMQWPVRRADAIVCINMIHISPWEATLALFAGARRILPEDGVVYLYGAYRRGGAHTASSNEAFDRWLRAQDTAWGVRDLEEVVKVAQAETFEHVETTAMPANNFSVVFRKRTPA
jgi:cyclopropane fatty-acyl-phospholipid synthase-like methyltransferase